MHLAEPRLLWRVKLAEGKWRYVPAHFVIIEHTGGGIVAMISHPPSPAGENQGEDESE